MVSGIEKSSVVSYDSGQYADVIGLQLNASPAFVGGGWQDFAFAGVDCPTTLEDFLQGGSQSGSKAMAQDVVEEGEARDVGSWIGSVIR
jgi:hypothetical protein